MNRIACVVFLVLVSTAAFAAQRDVTTIEVVQVPVMVTDHGRALYGLTRDDFKLFVNGKPQPIDYFDVVDFGASETGALAPAAPQQRRLYLLVFDLVFSTPNSIQRAQKAAAEYIDAAPPSDLFAVGAYSSRHGLQLAVPFTRDRVAVRRAISRLREGTGSDPLRLTLSAGERSAIAEARGLFDGGIEARGGSLVLDNMIEPFRRVVIDQIESLGELATRMAPIEGQKHVVLLSSGFSAVQSFGGVLTPPFQRVSLATPAQNALSSISYADPLSTGRLLDMHQAFNAAGVVLDAVDVYGIPGPWVRRSNAALYALTGDTGGRVVDSRNDLREALQHLTDGQRVVYTLGFHAPRTGREENSIRVKVRNVPRGSLASYRQSYSTTLPKPSVTDGLRVADILQNDIPQTGVSVAAKAGTSGRRATVTVEVPKTELAALGGTEGDALIYIYSGHAAVAFEQKLITAERTFVSQDFDLPPGRYAAKVLVRWDGTLGFARVEFTVE